MYGPTVPIGVISVTFLPSIASFSAIETPMK